MFKQVVAHAAAKNRSQRAEFNGVRFSAAYGSDSTASGDFVLVVPRGREHVTVLIGDACGRGAPAARFVSSVKPLADELARKATSPSALLSELNARVTGLLPDHVFVTAAALTLNTFNGHATCANAGHVPPILRRMREARVVGSASGPPLGMVCNANYIDETLQLELGDIILLMTDGVLEAIEDDLVGMPKLQSLLKSAPGDLREITNRILAEVVRMASRPDDRALVALEWRRRCTTPPPLELASQEAA